MKKLWFLLLVLAQTAFGSGASFSGGAGGGAALPTAPAAGYVLASAGTSTQTWLLPQFDLQSVYAPTGGSSAGTANAVINGVGSYLLEYTSPRTICIAAQFITGQAENNGYWVSWGMNNNYAGGIGFYNDSATALKPTYEISSSTGQDVNVGVTTAITDGKWHMICVKDDGSGIGSRMVIDIDGASVATTVSGSSSVTTGTVVRTGSDTGVRFHLGGRGNRAANDPSTADPGNHCVQGYWNQASTWTSVLSTAETSAITNNGMNGDLSKLSFYAAKNLSWWSVGEGGDDTTTIHDRHGVLNLKYQSGGSMAYSSNVQ